ncbi:MAG: DUF58 domain-containing protein [Gemmatimonadetes bacterium]|nr:DUF58 domain-containing protein [Gemmatimonadota bacterium]
MAPAVVPRPSTRPLSRSAGRAPGSAAPDRRPGAAGAVPPEILRQVRLIELRTRGLVNSMFGGEYQSVFKGQGMEFAEVREYQIGDDVRSIDWNVTARMRQPYVKKHVEERELTVLLAVDLSGSEQFGTRGRFKAELATEVAAVLALSAIRNNDRVGLLVFSDHVEHVVPPRKGRRHVLRLIRDLLAFQPVGRGTDLVGALEYALKILPHRSIIFVLSDFLSPLPAAADEEDGDPLRRVLRMAAQRHDLVAVTITDVAEEALPAAGLLVLTDPETGEQVAVDTARAETRSLYRALAQRERDRLRKLLRQLRIEEIEVRTDASYVAPLLAFFRRRERQLRR